MHLHDQLNSLLLATLLTNKLVILTILFLQCTPTRSKAGNYELLLLYYACMGTHQNPYIELLLRKHQGTEHNDKQELIK